MKYIIAGGWAAGTAAAQHLRRLDPASEITVVDAEPTAYYPRPDLIEYLAGRKTRDQLIVHGANGYAENRISLISGRRIVRVSAVEHEVTLDDGTVLSYGKLLLANGASPYVPPLPGANQIGVFALRTLDDADALLARTIPGATAVIVGGGLLGLEAARALAERGTRVTVIEFASRLLPNQLDERSGNAGKNTCEPGRPLLFPWRVSADRHGRHGATGRPCSKTVGSQRRFILFSTESAPTLLSRRNGNRYVRAVQVDDSMLTSGRRLRRRRCRRHRGRVYGIVPPCWSKPGLQLRTWSHGSATYEGRYHVESLKTCGIDVSAWEMSTRPGTAHQVIQATRPSDYRNSSRNESLSASSFTDSKRARQLQQAIRSHANLAVFEDRLPILPVTRRHVALARYEQTSTLVGARPAYCGEFSISRVPVAREVFSRIDTTMLRP